MNLLAENYSSLLLVHSWWRWVVLISALVSIGCAAYGLVRRESFNRKASVIYVALIDVQFLLGLLLYGASPLVRSAWMNMSAAMKQQEMRFFSVEHLTAMILAVALAHIGSVRAKRTHDIQKKNSRILLWHALSLIAILVGIPWWRPLFHVG